MFENMMKQKKSWALFRNWLYKKYKLDFHLRKIKNEDLILCIIPVFSKEYGIIIEILYNCEENNYWFHLYRNQFLIFDNQNFPIKSYIKILKKACEKAFEILEKQNV